MVRSRPVLAACALALLAPATAFAGPVPWEVAADLTRNGPVFGPYGYTLPADYIGGGTTIHTTTFSQLRPAPPTAAAGAHTAYLGSLVPDVYEADPLHWVSNQFDIRLKLTDLISGSTGTLTFTGSGWEEIEQGFLYTDPDGWMWGDTIVSSTAHARITGGATQSLEIGGNPYVVTVNAYQHEQSVDFVAEIRGGDIPATPEPATLALAALGLGGVWLRRTWR